MSGHHHHHNHHMATTGGMMHHATPTDGSNSPMDMNATNDDIMDNVTMAVTSLVSDSVTMVMQNFTTFDHDGDHGGMHHGNGHHGNVHLGNGHDADAMGSHGAGHNLYFHASTHSTILFKPWVTSDVGTLVGSAIGIFFLAVVFEGVRVLRERMAHRADARARSGVKTTKGATKLDMQYRWSVVDTLIQGFLHMLFFTLSYFLMLIFMTFNVWLCIAVVLGAGTGYMSFLRFRPAFTHRGQRSAGGVEMFDPGEDDCCV